MYLMTKFGEINENNNFISMLLEKDFKVEAYERNYEH